MKRLILSFITLLSLATYANGGGVFPNSAGGGATQPFTCNTNNTSCVTQADNGAVQRSLIFLDNTNALQFGSSAIGEMQMNVGASHAFNMYVNTSKRLQVDNTTAQVLNGATLQSAGGAVPTCSGGSGTCVTVTGSTNNRGQIHLTGGTAVTSITLTFSAAGTWAQAPFCTVGSGTAAVAGLAAPTGACASTASCAFAVSSTTAADINYTCL